MFLIRSSGPDLRQLLCVLASLCAFLAPSSLLGQLPDEREASPFGALQPHADAPRATAVRIPGSIRVDGRLDDAGWVDAPPISHFTQVDPAEGEPATEPTEVRIVYDAEALYVGAKLYDSGEVRTRLARRDAPVPDSDLFSVFIDSYHDHLTAYRFSTNPSGQKRDEIISSMVGVGTGGSAGGPVRSEDSSWDPVWEMATEITDDGWSVEMRIPFSQLRFGQQEVQEWGIQFERTIRRREEQVLFSFVPKLVRGGVARYAHLDGIRDIEAGRRLELLPYVGVRAERLQLEDATVAGFGNPYRSGSDYFGSAGLDLKYRVSSNLTLDGTVNPDFGQVEVDPAVINLTTFETRFDEKRPFFIEEADIFRFSEQAFRGTTGRPPEFLYSRRIGRPPQGSVPSTVAYSDEPGATTILGAAKLTGRTRDGWSVGLLDAVTQQETAPWIDAAGIRSETVTEPTTNYLVGRLRRDISGGRSRFGLMVSAANRKLQGPAVNQDLRSLERQLSEIDAQILALYAERARRLSDADDARALDEIVSRRRQIVDLITVEKDRLAFALPVLRANLHTAAYQAGVDFNHEWADQRWSLAGAFASSLVRGSSDAILRTQRSSARYFQRPDADHLVVDSDMTSLAGYYAMLKLAKIAGAYRVKLDLAAESPGYEINDLGFQSRVDRLIVDTNFLFQETVPGNVLRNWSIESGPDAIWNYGGDLLHAQWVAAGTWQFLNYWGARSRLRINPTIDDDRLTRGGPLANAPAGFSGNLGVNSDTRRPFSINASYNWLRDKSGTSDDAVSLNLTYRVRENWEIQLGPRYSRSYTSAQYVTAVADPLASTTFGRRYIFADLDQTTLSIDARLNVTLSPTLSFELYAQPFLSSGDFGDLKEFKAPQTFKFLRYGEDVGTLTDRGDGHFLVDPDGLGPAEEFVVANRDFNNRSLRGNAVLRWEWRAGSTLFLVWQQSRAFRIDASDPDQSVREIGQFNLARDTNSLFDIRPDNIFLIKVNYWLNP